MTATLFYNPLILPSDSTLLWLLLPVLVGVAVVYKTIRTKNLRRLWLEVVSLVAYMIVGLAVLAVVLWVVDHYWGRAFGRG